MIVNMENGVGYDGRVGREHGERCGLLMAESL
jgi:hypothetical protein